MQSFIPCDVQGKFYVHKGFGVAQSSVQQGWCECFFGVITPIFLE